MYFFISGYSRARTLTLKVRNSHVLAVNLRRRLDLESIHWDSSESNRTRIRVSDDFDTFPCAIHRLREPCPQRGNAFGISGENGGTQDPHSVVSP